MAYSAVDILYTVCVWLPHSRRLLKKVKHPPPLPRDERRALFYKCLRNIPDPERYLHWWFLGADSSEIRRDNMRDFVLWAFFDRASNEELEQEDVIEIDQYVDAIAERLGRDFGSGRGSARSLRLTLDVVETRYRSFFWYVILGGVDLYTHCSLSWNGFQYYAQPVSKAVSVIPPRPQALFSRKRSASRELSYWYRPHTAKNKVPVMFLHGIGVGLWTYIQLLSNLNQSGDGDDGQIGIIALELLPISFRLTDAPLEKHEFLREIEKILDAHDKWDRFVLAAHSYGTALATHMIKSERFRPHIHSTILMDPISILLHLPDIAYNFTRRKPRRANEWQLWYFASMDPGVALALGRHFFWKDNIIWKEELLGVEEDNELHVQDGDNGIRGRRKRNAAVTLAMRDLIVDTIPVGQYLVGGEDWADALRPPNSPTFTGLGVAGSESTNGILTKEGIEMLWFPLDHAQVFETPDAQDRVCRLIRHHCTT